MAEALSFDKTGYGAVQPRRLRLVARRAWRRALITIQARRRRIHRPRLRAVIQAARARRRLLCRLAKDRERIAIGC